MAKVTITFTDDNENGTVVMNADFDPPIDDGVKPTVAQWAAVKVLERMSELSGGSDDD